MADIRIIPGKIRVGEEGMKVFMAEKNKCNKGFSLVELVVAIGILAVISTIVAFMMTSSSRNYS